MTNDRETVRLNKYIAASGLTSRRGADDLVKQGRVKINGNTADSPGIQVTPLVDRVEVNGKLVKYRSEEAHIYIAINKPVRIVTTANDPQNRPTVMDLLPPTILKRRPFPIGRLDFFSEGLLLLTTDGELCNRMIHPRWHQPKVYDVVVNGIVTPAMVQRMENGMKLKEGDKLAPVKIKANKSDKNSSRVRMVLRQGVNRQIRRMFRDLGLKVLKLKRISHGTVNLGDLPPAKWRKLGTPEVNALKKALEMDK
jgi:23S rRNA pseudouridine2605 synthase